MFRLIYLSTPKPEVGKPDIDQILASSRKNNRFNNITGLLIQDKKRFLQYLEGDQKAVEETFNRIASDPRHTAVFMVKSGFVVRRQFPKWTMASKNAERSNSLVAAVSEMTKACDKDVADELLSFAAARDRAA
ncbi:BLUF domain-containing protein [Parasphingorhabdus sp.]|uniref:BLUF domain-containing protein n=1 Tax=Parasphingorhabdus sp. TaxID=2709688 RepID=UPI003BB13EC4